MKFEVLKRSHSKKNIIVGVIMVLIISAVILNFTRAKYRVTQSIPLVNGTINYTPYDFKMIAMYQENDNNEYQSIERVPISGYTLNKEESYCEVGDAKDNNIQIEYVNGLINFLGMTEKGTKCYLYFDKYVPTVGDTLLANYSTVLTRNDFTTTITNTTTGTIYKSANSSQYDDYGEVYYFAGNPTDNWVKFGGFYWRIIRINGNGSIRMIYQGTGANSTGENTQISTKASFNLRSDDNMYAGYMYTSGQVHGLGNSSNIKNILDQWYQKNLVNNSSKIDGNAGFCGDRTPSTSSSSSNGSGGTGLIETYYGAYIRLVTNKNLSFKCSSVDLYTLKGSDKGNKSLDYPVGLITVDEVWFSGLDNAIYSNHYLNTGQSYWLISPYGYSDAWGYIGIYYIYSNGTLSWGSSDSGYGVRPVINLKSNVTISSGDGTASNPYVIAT